MTVATSGKDATGLTVTLVARDPIVRGSLVRVLRECRIPVSAGAVDELAGAVPKPDVVCTGPSSAAGVLALDLPTVIVTRGLSISDEVWTELSRRRPVVIRHNALTPVTLLEGVLRARFGIDVKDVPSSLSWVPPALLRAFLRGPRTIRTIREFSCASDVMPGALRAMEKDVGCTRFEGLVTRLRAAVYTWLVCTGVDRTVVEEYLGIEDRSDFRRACRRARIPVPWSRE